MYTTSLLVPGSNQAQTSVLFLKTNLFWNWSFNSAKMCGMVIVLVIVSSVLRNTCLCVADRGGTGINGTVRTETLKSSKFFEQRVVPGLAAMVIVAHLPAYRAWSRLIRARQMCYILRTKWLFGVLEKVLFYTPLQTYSCQSTVTDIINSMRNMSDSQFRKLAR